MEHNAETDYVVRPYPEVRLRLSPERYWDWIAYGIVKPSVVRLKIGQEAEGAANLQQAVESGKAVFCYSNHVSWADHFLILNMIDDNVKARTSGMCKEKYYTYPVFGWLLKKGNMPPITNVKMCYARWFKKQNGRPPKQSDFIKFISTEGEDPLHNVNVAKRQLLLHTVDCVGELLNRNHIILGYPEGTRNEKTSLQHFRSGIIQLPLQFKGSIVPTAVSGTDKILPKGMKWHKIFKFYLREGVHTKVRFGRAIDWMELLSKCQDKFHRIGDRASVANVRLLYEQIENGRFHAYTIESERFKDIFKEASLIIKCAVNDMLPDEYKTDSVGFLDDSSEHPGAAAESHFARKSGIISS
jgi:1-acyl-sn-glycerol-3-phosphate acyltransferase